MQQLLLRSNVVSRSAQRQSARSYLDNSIEAVGFSGVPILKGDDITFVKRMCGTADSVRFLELG